MGIYTKHYNAKKPSQSENYDVDVANFNNDLWDEKIYGKQDKVVGKSLSTNDFTNEYKNKLNTLKNYDDTQIRKEVSENTKLIQKTQENIMSIEKEQTKQESTTDILIDTLQNGQAERRKYMCTR